MMNKKIVIICTIILILVGIASCDLFSLNEWFDFPTEAVITIDDSTVPIIGDSITLDGSSSKCGMNESLIYNWEVIQRPLGSVATLEQTTAQQSSLIPDYAGTYIIRLTVVDDDEDSNSCNYSIDVSAIITATAGTGGSITPSGDVSATQGSDKTFTITPETGYEIADVFVDGESVGAVTSHTFDDVTENHTISATFSLVDYVITASAGTGGSINPSGDVSVTHGDDKTFTITPETGYEIADIIVDDSGIGVVSTYTFSEVSENHTISATFVQSEFTITFVKNSTDATGTMSPESVTSGDTISLPAVGYTRSGYTFSGWATSSVGTVVYTDQASYTMGSSDVTLYAVWQSTVQYMVSFDKNDSAATGSMLSQWITQGQTENLDPNGYSKEGWSFVGWSMTSSGSIAYVDQAPFTMGSNHVPLYALWKINDYTITFDKNDELAEGEMEDQEIIYGETENLNANVLSRKGYSFSGWSTTPDGGIEYTDQSEFTMGSADLTLYAQWEANDYIISFNPEGGSLTTSSTKIVIYDNNYGDLPETSKIGYSFLGWWSEPLGEGYEITNSTLVKIEANHEFYALWQANTFLVSFNPDKGSNTNPIKISVAFDSLYGPLPITTRDGYDFGGWWTGVNGSGLEITEDSIVLITEDTTLYANWSVVGNLGPAGGVVFYDKGVYIDGWRYLECATLGWYKGGSDPSVVWGKFGAYVQNTQTAIGYGDYNTQRIISTNQLNLSIFAAKICDDYSVINDAIIYNDWFLPSKDELELMYINRAIIGSFSAEAYWSSSEFDCNSAWIQVWDRNYQYYNYKDKLNYGIRPIRAY